MIAILIIICFCLGGIGLSLDRIGVTLERIAERMKKGGEER